MSVAEFVSCTTLHDRLLLLARTQMIRAETTRERFRRAIKDVADIAPAGIGHWDRAWDITADADAELCRALTAWEASGAPADQIRVRSASKRFLESWQYAARRFELHRADRGSGPVRIIDGESGGLGFGLPAEELKTAVRLDLARVAIITEETEDVGRILEEVFDREGEHIPQASPIAEERGDGPLGLDKQHSALFALLTRQPRWTTSELDQAAEELGLLGSGALEVINDVAFDVCGELLLEGREPIEINDHAVKVMETQ